MISGCVLKSKTTLAKMCTIQPLPFMENNNSALNLEQDCVYLLVAK